MGKYVGYNYTTLGLASYGDDWRNLRKLSTVKIFSSTRLNTSLDIRRDENQQFTTPIVPGFRLSTDEFAKVELKSMFLKLSFVIIMRIMVGKQYLNNDFVQNFKEGRRFRKMINEAFEFLVSSYLGDFFPILQWIDYNGYMRRIKDVGKKTDEIMQGMIDEHRRNIDDSSIQNTMITHMLSLQESQPVYWTDVVIKDSLNF